MDLVKSARPHHIATVAQSVIGVKDAINGDTHCSEGAEMKVILSRKGFDSANGGIVSPIFEDGAMISMPIPASEDFYTYDDLCYCDSTYRDIIDDLKYKGNTYHCHVDPDLDPCRRKDAVPGWFPAFGQVNAAASYLHNNDISAGDLFLFFGNFHFVERKDGHYRFTRRSGDYYRDNDLQIIWGYLQIGEIISDPEEIRRVFWHPHSADRFNQNKTNVIFRAAEHLSFDDSRSGAGLLSFDEKRVLTLEGAPKATWKMNPVYDTHHIFGNRKNLAKDPSKGIYYAGIWQELCLMESEECTEWARSMIE